MSKRIAALERVRDGLATLIEACPGHGRAADCPILRALTEETTSEPTTRAAAYGQKFDNPALSGARHDGTKRVEHYSAKL